MQPAGSGAVSSASKVPVDTVGEMHCLLLTAVAACGTGDESASLPNNPPVSSYIHGFEPKCIEDAYQATLSAARRRSSSAVALFVLPLLGLRMWRAITATTLQPMNSNWWLITAAAAIVSTSFGITAWHTTGRVVESRMILKKVTCALAAVSEFVFMCFMQCIGPTSQLDEVNAYRAGFSTFYFLFLFPVAFMALLRLPFWQCSAYTILGLAQVNHQHPCQHLTVARRFFVWHQIQHLLQSVAASWF